MLLPIQIPRWFSIGLGLFLAMLAFCKHASAQCVRIRDPYNAFQPTFTPKTAVGCLGTSSPRNATVFRVEFESSISNFTISWGDSVGVSHTYTSPIGAATHTWADTGTFRYTITENNCGTVIRGIFINNYNTRTPGVGFVFPPAGTDNRRCLPSTLGLTNLSPGMNVFSRFIIDWGGQEKKDTVDASSYGHTINHTYKPGSRICRTRMYINYINICGTVPGQQPLSQSAGDYYFVEKDSAQTNPMKIVMCSPTQVIINDASKLNCLDTSGRKIAWAPFSGFAGSLPTPGTGQFGSYNIPANKRITIPASAFSPVPADSTFKMRMFLKNLCGTDTAEISFFLAQPKTPVLGHLNNNVCPGETVQLTNSTQSQYPDGVLEYLWDFGDGDTLVNNDPIVEHIYEVGGDYTVKLTCRVLTTIPGQACKKTSTITVNVRRTVTPIIKITPSEVCNRGVVKIQNKSVNTTNASWNGWELNHQPAWPGGNGFLPVMQNGQDTSLIALRGTNPADSSVTVAFKRYGRYILRLSAQSFSCPNFDRYDTLDIYPTATLRWKATVRKVCVGTPFQVRDSSVVFATDTNGLPNFRQLTWLLHMGDTTKYRSQAPVTNNFDSPVLSSRLTTHTYTQPGIYKVALTVWVGRMNCPVTDTIVIQALPAPMPSFSFLRNSCDNMRVRFVNSTPDSSSFYAYEVKRGTVLAARFVRTDRQPFDALLPYVPPGDSTYYMVTLKAYTISGTDTCVSLSIPKRLSIAPTPVAAFSLSQSDGCSPMVGVTFNNASFNMPIDTSNRFFWRFGQNRTSTLENPPSLDYINNSLVLRKDTVFFRITRRDGCTYESTREIYVFPSPNVQMTAPDSICSGVPADLSATGNNLTQYTWSFQDYDQSNTYDQHPLKIFSNYTDQARTYTIELTARTIYNCPQTVSKSIKIFPQPQVEIGTIPTADHHCSPVSVRFDYVNVTGASIFKWFFGPDSVTYLRDTSFTRSFTNPTAQPTQQNVSLVASNGGRCSTRVSRSITINPEVRASYTINAQEGCHPLTVLASNSSSTGADQFTWLVGSQVVQNQPILQQTLVNTYTSADTLIPVTLVVRNSLAPQCRDTASRAIRVHAKPRLDGISLPSATGCSPLITQLTATGSGIQTFAWDFGDGDDSTEATGIQPHTYENYNPTADRFYQAEVVASNASGCADTSRRLITVRPYTAAGIISQDTVGCSPFTARFSSAGSVNANRFDWDFGSQQTSNDANPIVQLINGSDTAQNVLVRLISQKTQVTGCPDTAYINVKLNPQPIADFTASTHIGCGPLPVRLTNQSRLAAGSYWIISSGGVSDTIRNQSAVFDTVLSNPNLINKSVIVDLVVTSPEGCVSVKRDFVTVYADVTARFELQDSGCSPHIVTITNRSSNNGGSWLWNFGDGNASSVRNPVHEFNYLGGAGDTTYFVKLTSISSVGGCQRTDSVPVKVHGRPNNNFRITNPANHHLQLPNNTITLANNTAYTGQWHYKWLFDDGTMDTSRARTFTHRYDFSNQDFVDTNFVITQIAYNRFGCTDTLREEIIIQPEPPVPNFGVDTARGCSPLQVAFYNRSSYGREYYWEFGDRGISDEKNPVHVYTKEGKYTVKLSVSGFGGTRSIVKDTLIEVRPFGSALFTSNPLAGMEVSIPEDSVEFRPLYPCPTCTYAWEFGDGRTSDALNPKHLYDAAGEFDVSLTVTSPEGCASQNTVEKAVLTVNKRVVFAPNAFVPSKSGSNGGWVRQDGRGINEVFYPFTQGAVSIKLKIFNRWGQLLYESTQLGKGWDGYVKNALAPMDTYVFHTEITFATGERRTQIGDVTLIH